MSTIPHGAVFSVSEKRKYKGGLVLQGLELLSCAVGESVFFIVHRDKRLKYWIQEATIIIQYVQYSSSKSKPFRDS